MSQYSTAPLPSSESCTQHSGCCNSWAHELTPLPWLGWTLSVSAARCGSGSYRETPSTSSDRQLVVASLAFLANQIAATFGMSHSVLHRQVGAAARFVSVLLWWHLGLSRPVSSSSAACPLLRPATFFNLVAPTISPIAVFLFVRSARPVKPSVDTPTDGSLKSKAT